MEDKKITLIVIDLSAWSDHYPTGCILYHYYEEIDSEYCDNTQEFIEFINQYKNKLLPYTEIRVRFDADDLDNEPAHQCAREVRDYIYELMKGE